MRGDVRLAVALLATFVVGCGTPASSVDAADAVGDASVDAIADVYLDAEPGTDSASFSDANDVTPTTDAPGDAAGPVTAEQLLALTASCARIAGSPLYATDDGLTPTIPLCQLNNAIFWQADMDIDCDGGSSTLCRSDPAYQSDTSAHTSMDLPLDASLVPFVVIPLPRTGFDYTTHGIQLGSVVAVIYHGQLEFAVFGDEGPDNIIGEGSYALATLFGIDSNPITGGVDTGVTYIAFTGASGVVTRNEDHDEAMRIGALRATRLVSGM